MNIRSVFLLNTMALVMMQLSIAQDVKMRLQKTVEAGAAFSIQSTGNGKATLYIVGPDQVLKREIQRGETTLFAAGQLYNAGHYLVLIEGENFTISDALDVVPARKPAALSFLAKPSRLPVSLHNAITGAVYVFDAYHNLILIPTPVTFEMTNSSGAAQKHIVVTQDGSAWTEMDSTAQQGIDNFVARIDDLSSVRVIEQVPGDPCGLKMNARLSGQELQLATDPVRDCNGNAIPDGTIVTFTETYDEGQSIVDVPLKHGIAEAQMSTHHGAIFSVASGVVLGNQIRWEK